MPLMSVTTTDFDLIRRAAQQIRDRAALAADIAPGEWYADPFVGVYAHGGDATPDCPKVFTDLGAAEAVIEHIAGFGPLVAVAIADWLDTGANPYACVDREPMLRVARAYLAPTSTTAEVA